MKKSSENNGTDLLQKWLSGDITRRQERQLEEKAKNDPFLADAMEGMRAFPEQDYEAKMTNLHSQLKNRYQKKEAKVIPFYFSRVAAMLAFAIIAGGMFWFLNQNIENHKVNADMAMEEKAKSPQKKETVAPSDIVEEIEAAPSPTLADKTILKNKPTKKIESKKSSTAKPESLIAKKEISKPMASHSPQETKTLAPPPPPVDYDAQQKTETENNKSEDFFGQNNNGKKTLNEENNSLKNKEVEIAQVEDAELSKRKDEAVEETTIGNIASAPAMKPTRKEAMALEKISTPSSFIQGTITDNQGEPLIGANVQELGTKNGVITDIDGRFQLELQQYPSTLDINYTGFSSQQIAVNDVKQDLHIELTDGIALDEVIVTSINTKQSRSSTKLITKAAPVNGFSKFKKYVKKNLTLTEAAKASQITGIVKVQFKINLDGSLSDFKILESLGYGLDEEAIRLLKEGGKWTLPTGQSSTIETYRFKFK